MNSAVFPESYQITTKLLYQGALIFALLDAVLIPVLVWQVQPERFRQIKWILIIMMGIFWFGIWRWAIANFWDTVYKYVFPDWAGSLIPVLFGLLMAVIGLSIWKLAQRFRFHPVIGYSLLGGLWGVCTHIWAVYRGIVEKPPMLQGASPVAAVVIAFFEYIFYWCIILSVAVLIQRGWKSLRRKTD